MSFGATPLDGSTTPLPMPTVVPDGTTNPVAVAGGPSYSDTGNTKAPASIYIKDGNNVTFGAETDAASTDSTQTNKSHMSFLKGLVKIFADVWDNTNHRLFVDPSDRWARQLGQVDIARVLGAAMSATNPVITQSQLLAALLAGKLFMYSTPKLTGATSTGAACLFNPNTSGKNLLIVSIQVYCNSAAQGTVEMVTADPALGNAMTIISAEGGSGAPTSVISTSASYVASGVTPSTAPNRVTSMAAGALTELLTNNNGIWLPSGVNSGVKVTTTTPAANPLGFTFTAIEY